MLTFDYLCRAALKWPRGPLVPEVTPSPAGQVFDIDAQEFDSFGYAWLDTTLCMARYGVYNVGSWELK